MLGKMIQLNMNLNSTLDGTYPNHLVRLTYVFILKIIVTQIFYFTLAIDLYILHVLQFNFLYLSPQEYLFLVLHHVILNYLLPIYVYMFHFNVSHYFACT